MRRILETIKNIIQDKPIFQRGKQNQEINNLQTKNQQLTYTLHTTNEQLKNHQKTINELQKTITTLGEKDQERTQTITQLQEDKNTLITNELNHLNKIATMRKDMQTQAKFMTCVNDAIHTMLAGLSQLPDTMPSQAPNFHDNTPLSTLENTPYRNATQEIIQELTNPKTE